MIGQYSSLYIPDVGKNPQSQQGYVVASGPEAEYKYPQLVVYPPYSGKPARIGEKEYLRFIDPVIVGHVEDRKLIPRPGHVVIEPLWDNLGERHRSGIIALDPSVFNKAEPPRFGRVLYGAGDLMERDTVILPPLGGFEIGWIDKVIYVIPARDVLATVENLQLPT